MENKTDNEKKKFSGFKVPRIKFTPMKVYLYILAILLTVKIVFDVHGFGDFVSKSAEFILSIFSYLIIGAVIAYVLNIYIGMWENRILYKMKNHKLRRGICITIAYLTMIIIVGMLIFIIIPALADTIKVFVDNVPRAFEKVKTLYNDILVNGKFDIPDVIVKKIIESIDEAGMILTEMINASQIAGTLTGAFSTTVSSLFNIVMGIMVSVYMLFEKDNTIKTLKRINYAIFSKKHADNIQWSATQINTIFRKYLSGKLIQAGIVLILSYIVFLIAGIDYAILLSVIMAVMNMIPYIGPWVGGAIVVFISVPQGFFAVITTLVCVLALQALDNWFIEPKIVGGKMGVSPLLVLVGLCVFGGLFGIPGMIMGDVMAAIFKVLFYDRYINNKINYKVKNGFLSKDFEECVELDEKPHSKGGNNAVNEVCEKEISASSRDENGKK